MLKKQISINSIFTFLKVNNDKVENKNEKITKFVPFDSATKNNITFLNDHDKKAVLKLKSSKASLIICSSKLEKKMKNHKNMIFVENPRLEFIRCLNEFFPKLKNDGIDSSSIIKTKEIGKDVSVGPFCHISKDVLIGDNVKIFGNVYIYDNTRIGNNVTIHAGTVIGTDGFGYERNSKKKLEKFPHIGQVEIQDNVEIGSNTCIDKATLGKTIIGEGTKIDNLVHISHNVKIGKNCAIVANSMIAGSCIIGNNVQIAMSSTIREKIKIGDNAIVGMGAVVINNVSKNSTVFGVPAKPYTIKQ